MLDFLASEYFGHTKTAAARMTERAWARRAETGPISDEWEVEDHLMAVRARIGPLNTISTDILNAGIKVYRLLWLDSVAPFWCLLGIKEKLREWRSSSARAEDNKYQHSSVPARQVHLDL